MTFSILHATWGRPDKAITTRNLWLSRAKQPASVEYIFACNADDPSRNQVEAAGRTVVGNFAGSAAAWDAAAAASSGDWLIQGQDDVEPPQDWDARIEAALETRWIRSLERPMFLAVSDGYRADRLCCTAIMNRARYIQQGEFLHAGYVSVFSDDEVTVRAYADDADKRCTLIEARELVFRHEHHYHNPSVPMDATYERENSSAAYALGAQLFAQRNANLIARGFRTWA